MKNMTTGKPLKLIFFFALPLMFGNLLQQMYTMVDAMIVGQFVGVDALASIGGADWINWVLPRGFLFVFLTAWEQIIKKTWSMQS